MQTHKVEHRHLLHGGYKGTPPFLKQYSQCLHPFCRRHDDHTHATPFVPRSTSVYINVHAHQVWVPSNYPHNASTLAECKHFLASIGQDVLLGFVQMSSYPWGDWPPFYPYSTLFPHSNVFFMLCFFNISFQVDSFFFFFSQKHIFKCLVIT